MNFEHDFLISYAHIDDQALLAGEKGWVSQLHRLLEIRVGQLSGHTPRIWRDPKLQGNDYFADTILERLPNVAALVSVLSPRYVVSEWCNRELKEFWRAAQKSGGVRVADKARIFKVVKTPVEPESLPEEVQPMLGYEFFVYDNESGRPRELSPEYGAGADRAFLTKVDDLAYDITQLLKLIDGNGNGGPKESKGSVFLAETTNELREEREGIRRDLVRNGFEVLPDRPLPLVAPELDAFVDEQLGRCKLSIHLIGRNYGIVPEGALQSLVERQQSLASRRGVKSLIWVAPSQQVEDERQRQFIERLHIDPEVHATAELLEVPVEDLKTLIHRKLAPPAVAAKAVAAAPTTEEPTRIYLLCDQEDVDTTAPLVDHLFSRGFEVILPLFDEDEAQSRIDHEESLQSADAVICYYGAGGELWLRRKLRELQKSAGLGREKPWLGRAIYIAGPPSAQKQRFRTLEATLLHEPAAGFDPAAVEPFLESIESARGVVR
ncbi:MAG TPA: toll/interleukin-1 receptor domain-containing protein [Thermoanaerobaculia bacterium]